MLLRHLLHTIGVTVIAAMSSTGLVAQDATKDVVEVVFTRDMDKADLKRIREEVRAQGIDLRYKSKSFENGRLHAISFGVETSVGSGTASTDDLKPDGHFGFRYDPRPGAAASLSVGSLSAGR